MTGELEYQLGRAVFNQYVTQSSPLEPAEAFTMFDDARLWLEQYLSKLISGYSPLRWLWLFRRIPHHIFATALPTTLLYDQALAETLTGFSNKSEAPLIGTQDGVISYSMFGATIRRLAEFCAAVRYLSHLHVSLRWAGKGAKFLVRRNTTPECVPEDSLKSAVRLYDQRGCVGTPLRRSGTILGANAGSWEKNLFSTRTE